MTQDNIVKFAEPGAFEDPLTEVLRRGARKLLADAIEAEVSDFLDRHSRFLTEEGSYDRILVTSEVRRQFELVLLQPRFRQ